MQKKYILTAKQIIFLAVNFLYDHIKENDMLPYKEIEKELSEKIEGYISEVKNEIN